MTQRAYILTDAAEADMRGIIRYTRKQWGDAQVRRYIAKLEQGLARLATGQGTDGRPYTSLELNFAGHPPLIFKRTTNGVGIVAGPSRTSAIMKGIGYQIVRETSPSVTILTSSQSFRSILRHNSGRANSAFVQCVRTANSQ